MQTSNCEEKRELYLIDNSLFCGHLKIYHFGKMPKIQLNEIAMNCQYVLTVWDFASYDRLS